MARTGIRFMGVSAWWLVVVVAMAGGIGGCATARTGDGREKIVWQSRDQYVKIEKQDRPAGAAVSANLHPADVPAERLRGMLGSIEVRPRGEEKGVRLFNDEELAVLGDNIHAGLAQAGPDEDVTFAIIGHYPVLMGLVKERLVTTGRVFCRDGEVDIIFGDVHRPVRENEDRRLYPFLPGTRGAAAPREWLLAARTGGETFAVIRPDWVTFSLASPPTPAAAPAPASAGPEKTAAPAISPAKPAAPGGKSAAERLMILNELHDKRLITDEEYRAKRLEILNEL
ncbi:MAG TPA: SHOCT domain-containing protein [Geobacteraceae bacterium]